MDPKDIAEFMEMLKSSMKDKKPKDAAELMAMLQSLSLDPATMVSDE